MKISKEVIEERENKLESAKSYLKSQFVGIDEIIDQFINGVRIWYLLPEIQTRPLIINLWGITGIGKTDLVRKFVNYIQFADRFCEIQLDSKDGNATIQDYLEMTFDTGEEHGILLLDEIQRFRSINEDGMENNNTKYQDIWMLLSDGTFQSDSKIKKDLVQIILEADFWNDHRIEEADCDNNEEEEKKKKKKADFKYKTYYWEASRLKKLLKTSESVAEVMQWSQEDKIAKIKERLSSQDVFEGTKYSKLLIVISGNLDEAFKMASSVDDADRDADVYHEYSKTINIINIKSALRNRFKPEQIARLGNVHLIYPILNRVGYYNIIKQKCEEILKHVQVKHNIKIEIDGSVYSVIYANGVFPTQGVRPLLSTISSIVENALPTFVFEHMRGTSKKKIVIRYEDGYLVSTINKKVIKHSIPRVLDDIKTKQTLNHKTLIAVHEAGHAVLYAILHKTAPTQIVCSTTNYHADGFVGTHLTLEAKTDSLCEIQITFGGRIAEDLVFGTDHITNGASSDYNYATSIAASMVRSTGMTKSKGVYLAPIINKSSHLHDINHTDIAIEAILETEYNKAVVLLQANIKFLMDVVDALLVKSSLLPEEFKALADKYIKGGIKILSAQDVIEQPYDKKLLEFKLRNIGIGVLPIAKKVMEN